MINDINRKKKIKYTKIFTCLTFSYTIIPSTDSKHSNIFGTNSKKKMPTEMPNVYAVSSILTYFFYHNIYSD